MTPRELRAVLRGVICYPVTPFDDDLRVNLDGVRAQMRFLVEGGVHAINICGGTGEVYSLTLSEYQQVVRAAVESVAGAVPVLAGVGFNVPMAQEMARAAEHAGADGLLIMPPYFVSPCEDGLYAYHRAILDATGLGAVLFHQERTPFTVALTERLAEHDQIVAFKDELGDLVRLDNIQAALGDRLAWINGMAERLIAPMFAMGAQAITSGVANVAPSLACAVYERAAAGRYPEASRLVTQRLHGLNTLRAKRPGYSVAAVKAAMNARGLSGGRVRPPLVDLRPEDASALRDALLDLDG